MVVDDHRDIVDTHAFLLETLGQVVARAYDGKSALGMAAEFRPDIVLLDLDMPGMSGIYVARLMSVMPELAATRIIAHTAFARPEYSAATESAGFDDFVKKPLALADLVRILLEGPRAAPR